MYSRFSMVMKYASLFTMIPDQYNYQYNYKVSHQSDFSITYLAQSNYYENISTNYVQNIDRNEYSFKSFPVLKL